MKRFDLEDRFIDFTIRISNVVDEIDNSKLGTHLVPSLSRDAMVNSICNAGNTSEK